MGLTQRINDRRDPDSKVAPIQERRGGTERRLPEWLRRAEEQGLPPKDLTQQVAA